jgi:Recombinase
MKKIDRIREKITILPTAQYLSKMHDAGWTLVALEWEREVEVSGEPPESETEPGAEEIPFGLRIAPDCRHLEDDPLEMQTLKFITEMIVQDVSFRSMADALNAREYRTRDGRPWNAASVFKLTPRLIEIAPRVLSGGEWESRKRQLSRVAWNS